MNDLDIFLMAESDLCLHDCANKLAGHTFGAVSGNQFEIGRKNGSFVLWEFTDQTEREAFRTDKKLFGMRLKYDAGTK